MKITTKIVFGVSIILILFGLIGVILCDAPVWSRASMIIGALAFLLWIILVFSSAYKTAQQKQRIKKTVATAQSSERRNEANNEYHELCSKAEAMLRIAHKPAECNTVIFLDEPYLFADLKSNQYFTDWEIWVNDGKLFFYNSEVENYPENCLIGEAPAINFINISDIQYFSLDGSVHDETIVSGGIVKQNKQTGKISQSPLKTRTVEKDSRTVKISVIDKGIVKKLTITKEGYDVLLALIPDKEK